MKQVLTSEQKPTFNADDNRITDFCRFDNGTQASLSRSYIL
ncbi:hypothetical protein LEP1GSC066_0937 [Leptospira sp. serovar Kenya str. Sh9]|nr:hypothetical protein LEP1GSC066_0054 [Leptospira sp. serovar Kenya str. Sh9]EMK13686.1 hypothetical protein LEP1GSC066_4222 [Leptospira sp. serovar Kenya str. Sh9]EMK14835.1 hypothetical protein LEP1GSC066_0937 [Leptospira sp. serovar Kenya str. Sh9]